MNGTCTMTYDKERHEFKIESMPEILLDLIIDAMWERAEYKWISELLSDEEATALADAGVLIEEED